MKELSSQISKQPIRSKKVNKVKVPLTSIKRAFRRAGGARLDARCHAVIAALLEKHAMEFLIKAGHCSLNKTIRYDDGMHALRVDGRSLYGIV